MLAIPDLKPCPSCNERQQRVVALSDPNYPNPNIWFIARIICNNCSHKGPESRCSDMPAAIQVARNYWNDINIA